MMSFGTRAAARRFKATDVMATRWLGLLVALAALHAACAARVKANSIKDGEARSRCRAAHPPRRLPAAQPINRGCGALL